MGGAGIKQHSALMTVDFHSGLSRKELLVDHEVVVFEETLVGGRWRGPSDDPGCGCGCVVFVAIRVTFVPPSEVPRTFEGAVHFPGGVRFLC